MSMNSPMSMDDLIDRLKANLADGAQDGLEMVVVKAQDALFEQGDTSDDLYLVVSGVFVVHLEQDAGDSMSLNRLAPGSVIGEIGLLTKQPRTATIHAMMDSEALRVSRDYFATLTPEEKNLLVDTDKIIRRWRRQQLAEVFSQLVGKLQVAELHRWQREMEWLHQANGGVVYKQGDRGLDMYLLVNGRLRSSRVLPDGGLVEGIIQPGQPFGNFGMRVESVREESVRAMRESDYVRIPVNVFEQMVEKYPTLVNQIYQVFTDRRNAANSSIPFSAKANLTLLPVNEKVDVWGFARQLAGSLKSFGPTLALNRDTFAELFGQPIAWESLLDNTGTPGIVSLFYELEETNKYMVLVAEPADTYWTQRCVGQADRVLIVGDSEASPEAWVTRRLMEALLEPVDTSVVLWHADASKVLPDVAGWRAAGNTDSVYQVVRDDTRSIVALAGELAGLTD
jgi:CRP-like cAMP-binding protein